MGDLDIAATSLSLSPAPRIRIMTDNNGIDGLHQLVRRQRPPRAHHLGQLGINSSHHLRIDGQQRARHDHPDDPIVDHPRREHRRHLWQPLTQTDRVMHQTAGHPRRHALRRCHLRRDRLPRIDPPQLPALPILDRNLTALIKLSDRRQPPRTRRILRPKGLADHLDHTGITHRIEHRFDTRTALRHDPAPSTRPGDSAGCVDEILAQDRLSPGSPEPPRAPRLGWRSPVPRPRHRGTAAGSPKPVSRPPVLPRRLPPTAT